MKKAILIIPLFLIGCATVKKTNTETEIKTDSVAIKETKKTETETNKKETISDYKANTLTYEPIDIKVPYYVDGKKYENVKVVSKEESEYKKINEEQQKQITTLINELNALKEVIKQQSNNKDKDYSVAIEIVSNRIFLLLIIIFVITMVVNYLKRKASII